MALKQAKAEYMNKQHNTTTTTPKLPSPLNNQPPEISLPLQKIKANNNTLTATELPIKTTTVATTTPIKKTTPTTTTPTKKTTPKTKPSINKSASTPLTLRRSQRSKPEVVDNKIEVKLKIARKRKANTLTSATKKQSM